jgi:hypothetical protein
MTKFVKDGEPTWRPAFDDGRAWTGADTTCEFFRVQGGVPQYCWEPSKQWTTREDGLLFVGHGPWTPYREDVETRDMSPEVRRWMVEHPGKKLVNNDEDCVIWWDAGMCQFRHDVWGGGGGCEIPSSATDAGWHKLRPIEGTWEDLR